MALTQTRVEHVYRRLEYCPELFFCLQLIIPRFGYGSRTARVSEILLPWGSKEHQEPEEWQVTCVSVISLEVSELSAGPLFGIPDRPLMASEHTAAKRNSMRPVAQSGKVVWEKEAGVSANLGGKGNRFIRFSFHKLLRKLANTVLSLTQSAHPIKKSHMTCLPIQTWAHEIYREQSDLPSASVVKPHASCCRDIHCICSQVELYLESTLHSIVFFSCP